MKIIAILAMMAACTPVDTAKVSYRDVTKPITSVALFDPARFSGHWEVVASVGSNTCAFDVVITSANMFDLAEHSCSGELAHSAAPITGPGRFTPKGGPNKAHEHWVMWVDQTYRVAVIGTVSGEFGMILSRDPDIPEDRLAAAREILDWNGYDLARLVMRPKGGL